MFKASKVLFIISIIFSAITAFSLPMIENNNNLYNAQSITISESSRTLDVGYYTDIEAKILPETASTNVTWTSSNKYVATVECLFTTTISRAQVTAHNPGTTTITATTSNGKKASCVFTITAKVKSISLNYTSQSIAKGDSFTLVPTITPSNANNKSITWSSSNNNIATVSANGVVTGISGGTATITATTNNNLYASCSVTVSNNATTYTISYALNGGTNSSSNPTSYTKLDTITLSQPNKTGYAFKGWTGSNGSTPQTYVSIPIGSSGNKNYTANWTPINYTITYNLDGGAVNGNPSTYNADQTITVKNPTKNNYIFTGWTGSNGNTPQTDLTIPLGSTGNKTYIANWAPVTYNIIYELNGGDYNENPDIYTINDNITLNEPTKTGYSFIGWTGSNGNTPQKEVEIPFGSSGSKFYTANWIINEYTISFNSNGGTFIESITLLYNTEVTAPINPTKENYAFKGWYKDKNLLNEYVFDKMQAENIILYAKWDNYEVSIEYNKNKTAIKENDLITAELFSAYGIDNCGNRFNVDTINYSNTQSAGSNISIKLSTTGLYGYNVNKVISVKVYGEPTISSYNTEKDFINYRDNLNKELFSIVATDTFGNEPEISLTILNENYKFGDLLTLQVSVKDIAGNETLLSINNIKYYGMPNISYNSNGVMKASDIISNELFNSSALDSFGNSVEVTTKLYSGTFSAGNVIKVSISAEDEKGNTNEVIFDVSVYGLPDWSTISTDYKVDVEITNETVRIGAFDSFRNVLTKDNIEVKWLSGEQIAGSTMRYQIILHDIAGNERVLEFDFKIYGLPTIEYDASKTGIKVTDSISSSLFNARATDSFGNTLSVGVSLYSGVKNKGEKIKIKFRTSDNAGNEFEIISDEINVYSLDDLTISYSTAACSYISINSHGEEFNPITMDTFGCSTNTFIEIVNGYLKGGEIISLKIGAIDNSGNIKYGEIINDILVYDSPTIKFTRNTLSMYSNERIIDLISCYDSMGSLIYPQVDIIQGDYTEGKSLIARITAVDIANNISIKEFEIKIIGSNSAVITMVCGNEILEKNIELNNDFNLPIPSISDLSFKGWKDVNGIMFTDAYGNSVKQINNKGIVELYADVDALDADGYLPILSTQEFIDYMTNTDYWDKNIRLYNNIDLNGMEWSPIGNSSKYFTGIFDGNGFTISNWKITTKQTYAGLFGYCLDACIKNLGVINFKIQFTSDSTIYSGSVAATIKSYVTISDCYSVGIIDITSSNQCYVGGLIGNYINKDSRGSNSGCIMLIQNCFTNCNIVVSGNSPYAGGIVGYAERINGYVYIRQSFTLSNITSNSHTNLGNIYGVLGAASYLKPIENVFGCSSQIIKCGNSIETYNNSKSLDELIQLFKTYTVNNIWNFDNEMPMLINNCSNNCIIISNAQDLINLTGFLTQKYKLNCDIDFENETYLSKRAFGMIFDGNGFHVNNISSNNGLFQDVIFSTIYNVVISNINIDASTSYDSSVGGLCGYSYSSSINKCAVLGEIYGRGYSAGLLCGLTTKSEVQNCYVKGNIKFWSLYGNTYLGVGGLIGSAENSIIKYTYSICNLEGQNNSESESYDTVAVGGLLGKASSSLIYYSYSSSTIKATRKYTSKGIYIGGLLGYDYKDSLATINNCYISNSQTYKNNSGNISWSNQMNDYSRVSCISIQNIWSNIYSTWDSLIWHLNYDENPSFV